MKIQAFYFLSILLITILVSSSCSNEVDINDDYKEISIVYGLLDQSESRHFVKLTKAFQTEGNVYLAAADQANSQYDPNDVEMWLEEYSINGGYIKSIPMDTVLITKKDSGAFYFPNQLVYATAEGIILNQNREYKLKAKIKSSGNQIEAETKIIDDFHIDKPISLVKYADFSGNYSHTVQFFSPEKGKLYQLVIRFYYTEIPTSGPKTSHFTDWKLSQIRSKTTDGGQKLTYEFLGSTFYNNLASTIEPAENGLKRWSDSVQYIISVADEDLTIYMDVNSPSTSIVQDKPAYSNIENGYGIFASRYQKIRPFIGLSPKSLDTLINGSVTYQLGFENRP